MTQDVLSDRHEHVRNQVATVAAASKGLLDLTDGPWVCPGSIYFKGVWDVEIKGGFLYPPETNWGWVNFEGHVAPGAIAGGGVGMAIVTVGPDELVNGEVSFNLNAGGVTPGVWNLNFWRGNKHLGSFQGGGLVEGACVGFGTGRFKRGRPSS